MKDLVAKESGSERTMLVFNTGWDACILVSLRPITEKGQLSWDNILQKLFVC